MYLVAGDVTNIALDPLFMFVFRLGVSGAAIAHVISQYVLQSTFMHNYLFHGILIFLLLLLTLIIPYFQINCVGT